MLFCLASSFWTLAFAASAFFDGCLGTEASRAAAVGLWMRTGQERAGGAPLTGSPLSFADGAGIGGVSSMVVPCFLVIFCSFMFSEALPNSSAALASVAAAAPISHGLGCIFGTIANMLSDRSTGMVSSFLSTLVLALVVLRGIREDIEE